MNRDFSLMRKIRAAKDRFGNKLQHWLLCAIENTPAPWRFALRNFLFTHFTRLFIGTLAYNHWQGAVSYFISEKSSKIHLINLLKIATPQSISSKTIAIQSHIFYTDLATELLELLFSFPRRFDLLISTPEAQNEALLRSQFEKIPNLGCLEILITPNRGRDLGPLLYGYGEKLLYYDYFLHVHTKKSSNANNIGNKWRQYLLKELLNSSHDRIHKILELLDQYGLVYPQKFPLIDVQNCQWGENINTANSLFQALRIEPPPSGYIEFPVGSMFWAKTSALKPLLQYPFTPEDFEAESGQTDQTIMHAIERSLTHISLMQGFPVALLHHKSTVNFYP